ncbi:MAG: hypothetical protein LBU56_02850 [Rickettsiales bacterium]|nr:hypothetical protein [Rickettsiales bacterium]
MFSPSFLSYYEDFKQVLRLKSELDQADWKTKFGIIRELVEYIKIDNDHVHIVFRFQAIALEMQRKNIQHHTMIPCHFNLHRLGS